MCIPCTYMHPCTYMQNCCCLSQQLQGYLSITLPGADCGRSAVMWRPAWHNMCDTPAKAAEPLEMHYALRRDPQTNCLQLLPQSIQLLLPGCHSRRSYLLVFMIDTIATASVEAIIAPNMQASIQFQPYFWRSSMYSMMGIIATHVAPTTRNASVKT
eukprot:GHUV01036188.1.p1 GENE.GHUV01036188.1~~GHUV01036188.1.p1  ORF type:complete len:157 (+),score=19.87 GHUV01036188.1:247-717(+)